ncbi:hypothetical protein KC19_3G212400 [Ceratodon purpureus]|uniref:Uncharacterized protein n=1 Tax=Ceratodon purpureus TaxID=3225 RepID=A0A8T0IPE2_CERPU|nr:hypothetical protein KC19_3G212400 [Ceratodon purpureus]
MIKWRLFVILVYIPVRDSTVKVLWLVRLLAVQRSELILDIGGIQDSFNVFATKL